jgi:hypothetical protein
MGFILRAQTIGRGARNDVIAEPLGRLEAERRSRRVTRRLRRRQQQLTIIVGSSYTLAQARRGALAGLWLIAN